MNFVRKALLPMGGVVALALIIMIASPRAAHALAAAMVQIMNTPTTAVPATHAPAANQIYRQGCSISYGTATQEFDCPNILPGPTSGKVLVVEQVTVKIGSLTTGAPATVFVEAFGGFSQVWIPMIQQGAFNGGNTFVGTVTGAHLYVLPGEDLTCSAILSSTSSGSLTCLVSGYYIPAQ